MKIMYIIYRESIIRINIYIKVIFLQIRFTHIRSLVIHIRISIYIMII